MNFDAGTLRAHTCTSDFWSNFYFLPKQQIRFVLRLCLLEGNRLSNFFGYRGFQTALNKAHKTVFHYPSQIDLILQLKDQF